METLKLKEEKMQVVRSILVLIIAFTAVKFSSAQEIIGTYKSADSSLKLMDIGVSYTFKENGRFKRITHEHLGKEEISGGSYTISGDTLILRDEGLQSNSDSASEFLEKKKIKSPDIFFSDIYVVNDKGNPQPGVNLMLQTKNGKTVMGFISDKDGKFPPVSIFDHYIKYLKFSFLGHKDMTINTDSLFGYNTQILVKLQSASPIYSNQESTVRLLIKNKTNGNIKLEYLNMKDEALLRLEKIE